jgi:hypothetical protein
MVKASQQNAKNSAFRLKHFVAPNKKKLKGQNQRSDFMKNVVCRLPYSVRVPMFVLTVLMAYLLDRLAVLAKAAFVILIAGAIILYFWLSLSANSLFFFIS